MHDYNGEVSSIATIASAFWDVHGSASTADYIKSRDLDQRRTGRSGNANDLSRRPHPSVTLDRPVPGGTVKQFLITYRYRLDDGAEAEWHRRVAEFISALDNDPSLGGRVRYRCLKAKDRADYYHLAEVSDDEAVRMLQEKDYFKRYTEETKRIGGGAVEVSALEIIAQTAR